MQRDLVPVVVPIAPFTRVFEALERGEIDAALLIHEGRLLFQERGYAQIAELGQWWLGETGLPLPLGVNVIRRGLGPEVVATVSAVLRDAIGWALGHREEVMAKIAAEERGDAALARTALLDRYLGMYANADTATMAPDVRSAIDVLFDRATRAGLLPGNARVEWAP
jgi:1,4-dihydroxy-6-naphthoate synthase